MLLIDGESSQMTFSELAGITEVVEIHTRTIDEDRKPAIVKRPTAVLKRPLDDDRFLSEWMTWVKAGDEDARRSGSLVAYDTSGATTAQWQLINAFPAQLIVSGSAAENSEGRLLFETVTLACDDLLRVV